MAVWATGPSVGDVESGAVATIWTPPVSIVAGGVLTIVGVVALRWFRAGVLGLRRAPPYAVAGPAQRILPATPTRRMS